MGRTAKSKSKSRERKKEAAADRRSISEQVFNSDKSRGPGIDVGRANRVVRGEPGGEARTIQSGLVVKRPGMADLNLDDLANCPTPEDALMLLSSSAANDMQEMPEASRLEVCKTIIALGDVVARTHAPSIAAIKLGLREDGGIETIAEANGRVFHKRADSGVIAGFSGAICAVARAEARQRTGKAHAGALEAWGQALVEAGQYLGELAEMGRSIGDEMVKDAAPATDDPNPPGPLWRYPEPPHVEPKEPPKRKESDICRRVHNPTGPDPFICHRDIDHEGECSPKI